MNRRLVTALAGASSIALGLLLLPTAAHSQAAQSHPVKLTGKSKSKNTSVTVKGPKMLNWHTITGKGTAKDYPKPSAVSVSVSKDLTNQMVHVSWTGFTPTNLQGGSPFYQYQFSLYPVEVVECKGAHPTKVSQCWQANNYQQQFGSNSNAVYATTARNGTGTADFQVQNSLQNSFLGCDSTHACSIVVVPSQGGLEINCANHSQDDQQALGITTFGGNSNKCAWAKRVVVPLKFGPVLPCGTIRSPDLRISGSPLMANAMAQWDTGLCRQHDPITVAWNASVGEPTAIQETVLDNLSDVALTTNPATTVVSGTRTYAYAPVGITAAALVYWFDDPNNGKPYTNIRLNPRLVAKLMTTSYTDYALQCSPNTTAPCDKAVNGNPGDLFTDKEFLKLNKVDEPNDAIAEGLGNVPIVTGGQSDITYEVTRWIASNSAAESFLKGHKDPWGMHINAHYKGVKYPAIAFTGQDNSFLLQAAYTPVATLNFVTTAMLLGQPPGSNGFQPVVTGCPPNQQCFNPLAGELRGQRSLFGITDEADAATYLLPTAAIENGAGKFVTPTPASMAAALRAMTTAKNGVTQQVNLRSKIKAAYPLTMVVYALVPIGGVDSSKAAKIAKWLNYVTGPGQTKGELPGRLPFGYLPLPANMRAQATHVAEEVLNQTATTSTPTPTPTDVPTTPAPTDSIRRDSSETARSRQRLQSDTPTATPTTSAGFPTATPTITTIALKSPATAGVTRYALPAVLILAGLAALLGASIGAVATGPGTAQERLRRLLGQGPARGSK